MTPKEKFVANYRRGSIVETALHLVLSVAPPVLAAAPLARLWGRLPHLPAWGASCLNPVLMVMLFLTLYLLSKRAREDRAVRVMRVLDAPGTRLTERAGRYVIQPHGFQLSGAEVRAIRAAHGDGRSLVHIPFVPRFDGWRLPSVLTLCGLLFVTWTVWYFRAYLPVLGEYGGRLMKAIRAHL